MTTINLLEKKSQENTGLVGVRRLVKSVTTAVLVIYLVAMAGFLGWEWWLSSQRVKTQKSLSSVTNSVVSQSAQEVLVRKIDARSRSITGFLASRPDLVVESENFISDQTEVIGWEYSPGGIQRVQVAAGEPEQIAEFSKVLAAKYDSVAFESIIWDPNYAWKAVIALGRMR